MTSLKIRAALSFPRLCFTENVLSIIDGLLPYVQGIGCSTGVFWGKSLQQCFEQCLETDCDTILAMDYDSVFDRETLGKLVDLFERNPGIDALAPLQAGRDAKLALATQRDGIDSTPDASMLTRASSAHFGLTLIRVDALRRVPKPWFNAKCAPDGTWKAGSVDEDIWFWNRWEDVGNTLYVAHQIPIGHLEQVILWPTDDGEHRYQHLRDYRTLAVA